jgi:hypothetical protein
MHEYAWRNNDETEREMAGLFPRGKVPDHFFNGADNSFCFPVYSHLGSILSGV